MEPSPTMSVRIRVEEKSGGLPTLSVLDADGTLIVSVAVDRADAGALGGQLLSAAHHPLQHPYLVAASLFFDVDAGEETGDGAIAQEPELATAGEVSPSTVLMRRPSVEVPDTAPATIVWSSHLPVDGKPESWQFAASARMNMRKNQVTEDDVLLILEDPTTVAPAQRGTGTAYTRKGIGAVVAADANLVIAVYREDPPGTAQRPHGGGGRRMPSTFRELRQQLEDHGFAVTRGAGGHPRVAHPSLGAEEIIISSTPSDPRSYRNAIAMIKQRTGIDITAEASR